MKSLIRLLKYTKQDWPYFVIATVSILAITALNLWIPLIIKQILSLISGGQGPETLAAIGRSGMLLLAAYLGRTFCQFM